MLLNSLARLLSRSRRRRRRRLISLLRPPPAQPSTDPGPSRRPLSIHPEARDHLHRLFLPAEFESGPSPLPVPLPCGRAGPHRGAPASSSRPPCASFSSRRRRRRRRAKPWRRGGGGPRRGVSAPPGCRHSLCVCVCCQRVCACSCVHGQTVVVPVVGVVARVVAHDLAVAAVM